MGFSVDFNKIREKTEDLVQAGAYQAKKLTSIARIKSDNLAQKDVLRKAYLALGQQYYAVHGTEPEEGMAEQCAKIAAAMAAIGANNAKLADMKTRDGVVDVEITVEEDAAEEAASGAAGDAGEETPEVSAAEEAPQAPAAEEPQETKTEE